MRVLFIVPYPPDTAPSQRLKFEQYLDYFRKNGITVELSSFMTPEFRKIIYKRGHFFKKVFFTILGYLRRFRDVFRAKDFDIIYLHLEAAPFGPPIFEYIFYKMKKPVIYDIDDVVYLPHSSRANPLARFLRSYGKIRRIMRMSAHIIVVTRYLEEFSRKYNRNVTYISPTINTEKYFVKDKDPNNKVCIGWTGSHSTSEYLLLIENVLRRISQNYDVRIKVIGDGGFKIDGLRIEAKAWSLKEEVSDIQDIDIGLYPLPKNEWIMGKGGLKPLQYMGMGIPPVCSRIGAVLDFIQDGVNGFLADSEDEWVEKISRLIEDFDLRRKIGLAARKTVEGDFSIAVNAPEYLKIIKGVCPLRKE